MQIKLIRPVLLGIVLLFLIIPTLAQAAAPAEQWNKTFEGSLSNAKSVQQTSDGGYIIAGSIASDAGLIKVDSSGNKQWNKTFGGASPDYAYSVQQTSDNGYIIAGKIWSSGFDDTYDAWLIKTDSTGNQKWSKRFGERSDDCAYSVQQTSDGGYILAGYTTGNAWLIKTNSSGTQQWNKTFEVLNYEDYAYSVQQTSDGGYIIAGYSYNGAYGANHGIAWLIKTDSNGNQLWNKEFGGTGHDYVYSVQQTSDGGYILAGNTGSYVTGRPNAWLFKVDSNGNQIWNKTFGGTEWNFAYSVQQASDGGYILAGETDSYGAGNYDAWLIKTDSNGNQLWSKTFGGTNSDKAWSVQQTSDGGYIIAAETASYGAGSNDAWLIKVAPDGSSVEPTEGSLVQVTGSLEVYLIENGMKRHFTSPEALEWNEYSFSDVIEISSETLASIQNGADISINQAIIDKYHALGGSPIFGQPVGTGELNGEPDSEGNYCSYVNFENGAIDCFQNGPRMGEAYAIFNPLFTKWGQLGYGAGILGYPIEAMSEPQTSKYGTSFRYQNFANGDERGALELNLDSGEVVKIHGAIFAKWGALGYATSDLGFPIMDQITREDGHEYCEFEGGNIEWDEATGDYKVTLNENNEAILHTFGSPSSNPNVPTSYDPVNMATGSYFYHYQDTFIPGRGLPLTIVRSYNSMDDYNGPFGNGWTFNYNMNLAVSATGDVTVMRGDGRRDKYPLNADGTYSLPFGVYDTLVKNADGTYALTTKDQIQYNFESQGKLTSILDKNDNQLTFTYTGDYLTKVTDASGRELILTYDTEGHIISITDPTGRTWSYSYDAMGNLIQCLNPMGGQSNYAYDENHLMTSITDPRGNQIMENTYDDEGRVISQSNALGSVYIFNYDVENKKTTETDPFGKTKVYSFDEHFWALSETDQLGNTVSYAYDENGNRISVTNENGQVTTFAYDGNGDITQITNPQGYTTLMTYDSNDNLISLKDALGRQMSLEYNGDSDLTKIINALGDEAVFTYDQYGQVVSSTNANGNTATFDYNANGDQIAVTDALDNTVSLTYDAIGRITTTTDANGNTYAFRYDDLDRVVSVTDPLGNTITNVYDPVGNRISYTDTAGSLTTYSYDPLNNLVDVTNAMGESVSCTYDAVGNMIAITDPKGHITNFNYDSLNRPVSVTDPLGYTASTAYDAVGNSISFTDATGSVTKYSYDSLNRLVGVTDSMDGSVIYAYDAVGNMVSMTDANGHTTSYAYDLLNRPVSVNDPLGYSASSNYDAVGNTVSLTDANGKITSYSYDVLNRLTQISYADGQKVSYVYDAMGNRLTMTDGHGVTNYEYDSLNRLLSVLNPNSQKVSYMYDESGNRVKITYPDGKTTSYSYDDINRLIGVTDWDGDITSYAYDANSNLINMVYPNRMSTDYVYDENDRLIEMLNKNESQVVSSFEYTLDAVGNRIKVDEQFAGRFESGGSGIEAAQLLTTAYEYDNLYRLTEVNYPFGKAVSYGYDAMGNRLSMTTTIDGVDSTVQYTYDAADRLLNSGSITYAYDNNGNLIEKKEKQGQVTSYTYDGANRLKGISAITNGRGSPKDLYNFAYDGDGNRFMKTEMHGKSTHSTEYLWDVNSVLPQVLTESDKKNSTYYTYGLDLISMTDPQRGKFYYQYDGLGSVRSLSDSKQSIKTIYFYDAFGQIQKEMGHVDNEFLFTGEQMDDETGLMYLRARYYDPEIGRFITKDPFEGFASSTQSLNRYSYVQNNPVNYVDPSGYSKDEPEIYAAMDWVGQGLFIEKTFHVGERIILEAAARAPDWPAFEKNPFADDLVKYNKALEQANTVVDAWTIYDETRKELERQGATDVSKILAESPETVWWMIQNPSEGCESIGEGIVAGYDVSVNIGLEVSNINTVIDWLGYEKWSGQKVRDKASDIGEIGGDFLYKHGWYF